ncbi:hypothetical protein B0H13DRAFT_1914324 [Mycena leptocephala]|nr:hypothetical protein B0H13DRAFT_1914324 [Mycena leptocephala]
MCPKSSLSTRLLARTQMADWVDVEDPLFALRHLRRLGNLLKTPHSGLTTWNQLLPQLETPWLQYYERTHGRLRDTIPAIIQHECTASCEASSVSKIKCLYPTLRYCSTCDCKRSQFFLWSTVLPCFTYQNETGVAIDLLDLYRALFERPATRLRCSSCASYPVRPAGFSSIRQKASEDEQASDLYRRLLIQAVQWAANLRDCLEKQVAAVLARAESSPSLAWGATIEAMDPTSATAFIDPATSFINPMTAFIDSTTAFIDPTTTFVDSTTAAFVDPATAFGPLKTLGPELPPIVICPFLRLRDHRQPVMGVSATATCGRQATVHFIRPQLFHPKHKVDAVGQRLEAAKKRPAAKAKPSVPQEVIDACQESWDAANETKRKADPKCYDASGIFVIFLCNVDTPGEQQRYIVAMLEEVFTLLPHMPRFCKPMMWVVLQNTALICPRFRAGIGLADHESVERSGHVYASSYLSREANGYNSRRIWMIDQYATFVSLEGRDGLGNWIHRQQRKNMTPKNAESCAAASWEWVAQKAAQTSIHAHAPARLQRELDKVLLLQNQIDSIDKAINDTKKILHSSASPHSLAVLQSRENPRQAQQQGRRVVHVSQHPEGFPRTTDLPLESTFANAISSFFEWESLDRAVSGRREALGTKLHQSTRKAISRRQPSLLKAIKKFNAAFTRTFGLPRQPGLFHGGSMMRMCAEEVVRLNMERENLRRWLLEEQKVVERAIEMEQASPLTVLLQWCKDALANLERSWAPCLRFQDIESHFVTQSTSSATTFGTSTAPFGTSTAPFHNSTAPFDTSTAPFRAPTIPFSASATTSNAASLPSDNVDISFIPDLATRNASLQVIMGDLSHFVVRPGLRPLEITPRDLAPFLRHNGRLNGFGLNGVAASVHTLSSGDFSPTKATANQCAVFSTYDLPCVRYKGSDPDLWRLVSPTQYWEKPLWLIPIHRPQLEHWVLVVVVVPTWELFFFDSMASRRGWRKDLRDVMVLITRLVALSNRNQHPLHVSTEDPSERWVAHPLFTVGHPWQTNGYDCGLWVLCMMAAIMRGYRDVHLSEDDMPWVRERLFGFQHWRPS